MRTSILISSIAALCLLATLAVTPRHHGDDKLNTVATDNISCVTIRRVTMLPGVVVTATGKKTEKSANTSNPAVDYSYLNFDVTDYIEVPATNPLEAEVLPEATEKEFSYLKFTMNDFYVASAFTGESTTELPQEENITDISACEPAANLYEYLRFAVSDYINNSASETAGIGELPSTEAKTDSPSAIMTQSEIINKLAYKKIDLTKFYNPARQGSFEPFELPEAYEE